MNTRVESRTGSTPGSRSRPGTERHRNPLDESCHRRAGRQTQTEWRIPMTTTQMVSFQPGNQRLEAYLSRPEGEGPFPGIVVIHEAFGLNDNIKDITQRFAEEGYVALAVDLFANRNRAVCMARIIGGMLRGSPDRFGVSDLKAALSVLAEQPSVDAARLGAIGFCMGGGFAIAWACTDDR